MQQNGFRHGVAGHPVRIQGQIEVGWVAGFDREDRADKIIPGAVGFLHEGPGFGPAESRAFHDPMEPDVPGSDHADPNVRALLEDEIGAAAEEDRATGCGQARDRMLQGGAVFVLHEDPPVEHTFDPQLGLTGRLFVELGDDRPVEVPVAGDTIDKRLIMKIELKPLRKFLGEGASAAAGNARYGDDLARRGFDGGTVLVEIFAHPVPVVDLAQDQFFGQGQRHHSPPRTGAKDRGRHPENRPAWVYPKIR